ncbi:MAG: CDP-alcohol phosphatidyltransferase family protein [Alphaproteobacteria bacterium]|nr:CDP-alcohol phosphatidyltransferase family protein [Alphaproteobacteria bacterium]
MNKKLIRLWATKTKDDEWWSSFVTSPLAIAVNYFVVDIKWLTPNLITFFSFIIALISALFILAGGTMNFIVAAILIHLSHILDCMDGQMARYRKSTSQSGAFYDKLTDQIQVTIWFGSVGYAAYAQSHDVVPVFLAFAGVAFYSLRGYVKYVTIYTEMSRDNNYLEKLSLAEADAQKTATAGLEFDLLANLKWFAGEQRKIILFNEGVFIFMLSLALILDQLTPMLWIFAISQIYYGLARGWQRGRQIGRSQKVKIEK